MGQPPVPPPPVPGRETWPDGSPSGSTAPPGWSPPSWRCSRPGAAYVPLDPAYPAERLAFALEDSGATLLVEEGDLAAGEESLGPPGADRVDPDLAAYVIYTSGSTGRPKGVVVTHANVDRLFTATEPWFGFGPDDVWTLFHSYAFDFSVWEIWGALLYGGRLVVVPYWESREPEAFYRLLRDERVTVLNQTPSAFRQLLWAEEAVLGGCVSRLGPALGDLRRRGPGASEPRALVRQRTATSSPGWSTCTASPRPPCT